MVPEAVVLLFSLLFMCLAARYATASRQALTDARLLTREMRSSVADLELDMIRNAAAVKKMTAQIGGLSRSTLGKTLERAPGALPDPKTDPEGWRAAVRARKPILNKELQ